jgi:methyl-accepting chemotaxis protein
MILLGAVGIVGWLGAHKIYRNLEIVLNERLPALDYLMESDRDLQQLLVAERSMIFSSTDTEVFNGLVVDYNENFEQSVERIQKYEALPRTDKEKKILQQYKEARSQWETFSRQIVEGRKQDDRALRRLAIDLSLTKARVAFEKMRDFLNQLQELNLEYASELTKNSKNVFDETVLFIDVITAAAVFFVVGILFMMNRTIVNPVKNIVNRSYELLKGHADLTKRLAADGKDEIGELAGLFDKFIERIQTIVIDVKSGTSDILQATDDIATGSQELAGRTNQQAASVTETSTTLEEFTAILKQNSEQSQEANSRIGEFNLEVQNKRQLIQNVTTTMAEIDKSSKEIGNIMNVINDISFQTNLLALNAAVEAARAGEAGRGFAVVASEVRNLAQKTADSSKTIQEIVTANISSTQKGMQLVNETEIFFGHILKMLEELSNILQNIEEGSREQSTGMDQINQAVIELDQVINQNAELVSSFAETGQSMSENAAQFKRVVEQFRTDTSEAVIEIESEEMKPTQKTGKKGTLPTPKKAEKPQPATPKMKSPEPENTEDFFGMGDDGFEEF